MATITLLALCLIAVAAKPGERQAPFEDEIRAYEATDAKNPPTKGGVLFVGSSSIRLWTTLAEDFPDLPVLNRGFGGSRIAHATHYADRIVLPYEPKTIVFYAGDNDLAAGNTPQQVLADFRAFVEHVRAKLPETTILFISIKPSTARWKLVEQMREANRLVKEFCEAGDNLVYVDVFTPMLGPDGKPRTELLRKDGLHLTREGYKVWRDAVAPHLQSE